MKHETIYFQVVIDFPGNDWPVGKDIVLNQYDSLLKCMYGEKKGRRWVESTLRKYPGIYKEINKKNE